MDRGYARTLKNFSSFVKYPHNKKILTDIVDRRYLLALQTIESLVGIVPKETCKEMFDDAKMLYEKSIENIENGGRFVVYG